MLTLKVLGQVDELHRLTAAVPDSVRPGQVEIVILIPTDIEDETAAAWTRGVSHEWHDELNDAREDIYTLVDGEPVDEAR